MKFALLYLHSSFCLKGSKTKIIFESVIAKLPGVCWVMDHSKSIGHCSSKISIVAFISG